MGFNSTLVVLNDGLHVIREDPEFGRKVHDAILRMNSRERPIDISIGGHANVATVVECHHADGIKLIAVGGNCGQDLGYVGNYRSNEEEMLRSWARKLGYRLVRQTKNTPGRDPR